VEGAHRDADRVTNQSWESRHQSVVGTYENKVLYNQQEIDRLRSELNDTKARMTDNSDPIAIVHKAKEIREAIGGTGAVWRRL
jgi:hypothetical protein